MVLAVEGDDRETGDRVCGGVDLCSRICHGAEAMLGREETHHLDPAVDQGIEEEGVCRVGLHGCLIGDQSHARPLGEADDLVHPVSAHLQLC